MTRHTHPVPSAATPDERVTALRSGDRRALAAAVTDLERLSPEAPALLQALQKATAHAWAALVLDQTGQQGGQALIKTGDGVGGMLLQLAYVHPSLNDRAVGPDIGSAQMGDPEDIDIDVSIDLGLHGAVGLGQSTNMALPALCILAYPMIR